MADTLRGREIVLAGGAANINSNQAPGKVGMTLGASRGAILRIFVMCGASVGLTGTATGTLLGVVFCANIETIRQGLQSLTGATLFDPTIYYLEHLPAKIEWRDVAAVVGMALLLSLLATLYPSWRAARTDPVEALRHE